MKDSDTRGTPWDLFYEIEKIIGCKFDVDVCTNHTLAKCDYYYTLEGFHFKGERISAKCGLTAEWDPGFNYFCNPPFSKGQPLIWLEKCWEGATQLRGSNHIVALVPSTNTEQPWWQEQVEPYRDGNKDLGRIRFTTKFLKKRRSFTDENGNPVYAKDKEGNIIKNKNGEPKVGSPRFGLCLLHWRLK